MDLKVRNNSSGRTAIRYLGQNQGAISKVLEKLSSGYRINRSADDAAGLAVSEEMRALITGLKQASLNARYGQSLIQTGEGSLQELHSMLNRALYLADYSASGTYVDENDREALQAELDEICEDIERITKGTTFNGIPLFQDKGYSYETTKGEWKSLSQQTGRTIATIPKKACKMHWQN